MLTGDENIVEADGAVFWKIRDPGQFLFKVDNPELAVRIAAEGALRDVISRTPIQAAMSNKRQQIADETQALLQKLLDDEQAGVEITQVQLQRVEPPLAVIDAFNDVQRARADQERARNEAEAYANDILPRARGDAERIRQEAEAYKVQVVNLAHGDADAFVPLLRSYEAAKDVTARRLYMDSVDELLKKSSKVIVDASGKGVSSIVPYLPMSEMKPLAPAAPPPPAAGSGEVRSRALCVALVPRRARPLSRRLVDLCRQRGRAGVWSCGSARRSASSTSRASSSRRRSSTASTSRRRARCCSSRRSSK